MDIKFVHVSIITTEILSKVEDSNNSRKRPPGLKMKMDMKRGEGDLTRRQNETEKERKNSKYPKGFERVYPKGTKKDQQSLFLVRHFPADWVFYHPLPLWVIFIPLVTSPPPPHLHI